MRPLSLFFLTFLLLACQKEEPDSLPQPNLSDRPAVLVSNEGGFGFGNASATYLNLSTNEVQTQVFQDTNDRPLGDVLQSILILGEQAFFVVNNSNKIEVVNLKDFSSIATIEGFTSPRYLLPVSNTKAYVSDLYANAISIVDLENFQIIGEIPLEGWSEEMVIVGETVYVTIRETDRLMVIDSNTDSVSDFISPGFNPSTIQKDKNDHIWVLCSGDPANQVLGGIYRFDARNWEDKQFFAFNDFEIGGWPRLRINGSRDTLYYLKDAAYQLPITAQELQADPIIPSDGRTLYGLGVDPNSGAIFVADAIDYQQKGTIYQYDPRGELLFSFKAGVIPNDFVFY